MAAKWCIPTHRLGVPSLQVPNFLHPKMTPQSGIDISLNSLKKVLGYFQKNEIMD